MKSLFAALLIAVPIPAALAQNHTTWTAPTGQQPSTPYVQAYPPSAPYSGALNSYNAGVSTLNSLNNGASSSYYGSSGTYGTPVVGVSNQATSGGDQAIP